MVKKRKNSVNVGDVFGKLTVIEKTFKQRKSSNPLGFVNLTYYICVCDCGITTSVQSTRLTTGYTKSCRCLRKNSPKNKTHGMRHTKLYKVWCSMHDRCYLKTAKSYPRYGGKGITICDKWHTFEGFYEDMGTTYQKGLSIDRINSRGNYCLENCRWANKFQQANNKSDNLLWPYDGKLLTTIEFAKILGIKPHSLHCKRCRKKYGAIKRYSEDNGSRL